LLRYVILGLAALAILWLLHSVAQWAEERGWIYYRKKRGSSGTLSAAALEVQSLFEPSQRHVLEEKKRDRVQEEEGGDLDASATTLHGARRRSNHPVAGSGRN
jgi:hypothetical protein